MVEPPLSGTRPVLQIELCVSSSGAYPVEARSGVKTATFLKRGGRLKSIKHQLGDWERIEILPLADLHIGDLRSDGQKITEWLSYIRETENCFTILNGDLMNTAIKSSVSDTYAETLSPMLQLEQCVKLFEPLREKILCVTGGNHERRIWRQDGIDTTQLMCDQLQIGDRYAPESAVLFVQFGDQGGHRNHWPVLYSLYVTHGSGGGRKEGGKVNRLVELASIVDCDIYIHSHVHSPAIVRNSYFRTDSRKCTVRKVDKLFVNTASSLEYGGYGEIASYKPNSLETPMIILSGRTHRMQAIL